MTISQAVTMTGVAQSTWYFRIKQKEWPTRTNAKGEKEVWAESQKGELAEAIAELRAEAAAFREMTTEKAAFDIVSEAQQDSSPEPFDSEDFMPELTPQNRVSQSPATALPVTFAATDTPKASEQIESVRFAPIKLPKLINADAVIQRIDQVWPLTDTALSLACGFDESWLSKARSGRMRSNRKDVRARWAKVIQALDEHESRTATASVDISDTCDSQNVC